MARLSSKKGNKVAHFCNNKCKHEDVAYCENCATVYCKDCGAEWEKPKYRDYVSHAFTWDTPTDCRGTFFKDTC